MSFEIYVLSSEQEAIELASLDDFRRAFGNSISEVEDGWFKLVFANDFCDVSYSVDEHGYLRGFTIFRPIDNGLLWNGLFTLLSKFHYFAVWPGNCGPLLCRPDVEINEDIIESLGPVVWAHSALDISLRIKSS